MKIELRSLRAINCGPLRDDCIHFTPGERGITVLAGANGSGKTTVLELILGLAELLAPLSFLPPYRPSLIGATYAQMDWLVDGDRFSIFYGQRPPDAKLPNEFLGINSLAGELLEDVEGSITPGLRSLIHKQQSKAVPLQPDVTQGSLNRSTASSLSLPSVLYFPHTRVLLPVSGQQISREATAYQWTYFCQFAADFRGSLSSYLIWLDYAEPEAFAHIIEFLNGLNFDGKTFGVARKELQAVVTTRDGQTHDVSALSSGEQNILIMLLELRRRLLPHSIVLIDEIENSLHPAFQKRLAESLKQMQEMIPFQLIVTTHSTTIVEAFGPASTRILTEF